MHAGDQVQERWRRRWLHLRPSHLRRVLIQHVPDRVGSNRPGQPRATGRSWRRVNHRHRAPAPSRTASTTPISRAPSLPDTATTNRIYRAAAADVAALQATAGPGRAKLEAFTAHLWRLHARAVASASAARQQSSCGGRGRGRACSPPPRRRRWHRHDGVLLRQRAVLTIR
jgi:hypothetical protein